MDMEFVVHLNGQHVFSDSKPDCLRSYLSFEVFKYHYMVDGFLLLFIKHTRNLYCYTWWFSPFWLPCKVNALSNGHPCGYISILSCIYITCTQILCWYHSIYDDIFSDARSQVYCQPFLPFVLSTSLLCQLWTMSMVLCFFSKENDNAIQGWSVALLAF